MNTTHTIYKFEVNHIVAGQIFVTTGYATTESEFMDILNLRSDQVISVSSTQVIGS